MGPRRRIGIFGGTFDPIHVAHLRSAEEAREQLQLDQVLFVPAADPPHKRRRVTAAVHRLAMVRLAVAGNPAFLLLDESTSHLDTVTEAAVDRNLDALPSTRVVIAHRLSTIRNADLIVVLENGSIVEQGSHRQLVARGGVYAGLIHGQVSHAEAECEV